MCMCVGGGGFFKGFPLPVSIPEGETCYNYLTQCVRVQYLTEREDRKGA